MIDDHYQLCMCYNPKSSPVPNFHALNYQVPEVAPSLTSTSTSRRCLATAAPHPLPHTTAVSPVRAATTSTRQEGRSANQRGTLYCTSSEDGSLQLLFGHVRWLMCVGTDLFVLKVGNAGISPPLRLIFPNSQVCSYRDARVWLTTITTHTVHAIWTSASFVQAAYVIRVYNNLLS